MLFFDKNQEIPSFSLGLTQTPPNNKAISRPSTNTRSKAKKLLTKLPAKDILDTNESEMEKDNITYKEPKGKESVSKEIQHNNDYDDEVTYDERDERTNSKLA